MTIEDLDTLRADLGQPKLNYIGFSYGTYLGELYAQKYPTHVRGMVLDGVINPALGLVGSSREQANGFEGDLHAFFSWCDANSSCHKLLPQGAKQAYDSLWSRFESGTTEKAYLKSQFGGTQKVTWGDAYIGVIQTLYSKSYWPYLGQAINETLKGDGSLLLALAFSYLGLQPNGTWSNEEAANVAINCVDSPSPRATSFYENLATTMQKTAPDFGAAIVWGGLVCAVLAVRRGGRASGDPRSRYPEDPRRRLDRRPGDPVRVGEGGRPPARQRRVVDTQRQRPHRLLLLIVYPRRRQQLFRDDQGSAPEHGLPEQLTPFEPATSPPVNSACKLPHLVR